MPKILIVDDEAQFNETLQMRLSTSGYQVITAKDGEEGLERAREDNPDLVILDIMMPNGDGYEVCRTLRENEHHKHIPIIFLSAKPQHVDAGEAEAAGADAYLEKPYEPSELLAIIEDLLKR